MEKSKYQTYINNFRRRLSPSLKPNVGISCNIYPTVNGEAILEFIIGDAIENDDNYNPESENLGVALSKIEQHAFGGNLQGFSFGGTNTILEHNRVIYIKDPNKKEWSDEAARRDVIGLIANFQEASK